MKRTVAKVRVGEKQMRVKIRLEEDPTPPEGVAGRYAMAQLLRTVIDNPLTVYPGAEPFQKLTLWHDGSHWILETDSTIERVQ
jgi:hypothetical protein